MNKKILIFTFLFMLFSVSFVNAQELCDVGITLDALRKALYAYYINPEESAKQFTLDDLRGLLSFYIGIQSAEGTVGCSDAQKSLVSKAYVLNDNIPSCTDGTKYGKCNYNNKPMYCYAGRLVPRCKLCGCPTGQWCDETYVYEEKGNKGQWGKCYPGTNITCTVNSDCGISGYVGEYYCQNGNESTLHIGDVYRKYHRYECSDPGKENSTCWDWTEGMLIDDCQTGEQCIEGQAECQTIGGLVCSDGTAYGQCSATKPKYCYNGTLIDNPACNLDCGCTSVWVDVSITPEIVSLGEPFYITVNGFSPYGLAFIWWFGSGGTSDTEFRKAHTHDCNNAQSCTYTWTQTFNTTANLSVGANARDHFYNDLVICNNYPTYSSTCPCPDMDKSKCPSTGEPGQASECCGIEYASIKVTSATCTTPTNGMSITKDTTFCAGTYNLPDGVKITADNVVLDCNNAVLNGNGTSYGIQTSNRWVTIKNCVINSFGTGIRFTESFAKVQNNIISDSKNYGISTGQGMSGSEILSNELNNNQNGIYVGDAYQFTIKSNKITGSKTNGMHIWGASHGQITYNTISNSGIAGFDSPYRAGIQLTSTNHNNTITQNTLTNNQQYNILVRPLQAALFTPNKIWNNHIYKTNIYDENESLNIYCVDGKGNNYYEGATGPKCQTSPVCGELVQITTDTATQGHPAIYDDKIIWSDYKNGDRDIYMYDLSTSQETRITTNTAVHAGHDIYGDKIVWADYRKGVNQDYDIYIHDLSTGQETQITTNTAGQWFPNIYGDKIVWQDNRNGNYDIYMHDLSTGQETQITNDTGSQMSPSIYGNKIVWSDNRNGNSDIYMYDISTGQETQITTNTEKQADVHIYDDKIVWYDYRSGNNYDIYMYDLSTGQENQITADKDGQLSPAIYGDKIVWAELWYNGGGHEDIFLYDLSIGQEIRLTTSTKVTTPTGWYMILHKNPDIYDYKIVWADNRNGNYDIYMTTVC